MKKLIIRILSRYKPEIMILIRLYQNQVQRKDSYLHLTGWVRSMMERKPCQSDGSPVPWMNYPVIAFLRGRLNRQIRLFEYGSGYSTLFFSGLVREVVSVEYDPQWHDAISRQLPENATLMLTKNDVEGNYCRAIHKVEGLFDVVVVDGRDRVNCIKQALTKLNDTGVIVLDDAQRDRYQAGIEHAMTLGFKRLDFEGLKPAGNEVERTAILYRSSNCLNL